MAQTDGWIEGTAPGPQVAVYTEAGKRTLVPVVGGHFRVEGLSPGSYCLESPPQCRPGDSAWVDEILAHGGCVYFERSLRKQVEVMPDHGTRVEF